MVVDITVGSRAVAPANLSMPDFQALYSKYGEPAKSSRFLVSLLPPPAILNYRGGSTYPVNELSYLCEAAELPGRGFMTADLRYYGPNFKSPYQSVYEDINLTFLVRDKFGEREFFDNWMEVINPSNRYDFAYRNSYLATINIFQMSDVSIDAEGEGSTKQGQQRYALTLQKAFPILVNPQPVTWADDNFQRVTVTFTYTRWIRTGLDTPQIEGSSSYELVNDGSQNITTNGTTLPLII